MKKDIVIAGSGGMGREAEWLLKRLNQKEEQWNFLGFVDEANSSEKVKVIGNDEYILSAEKELYVVIAIGNPAVRKKAYDKYKKNPHIQYPNLIDPSAIISSEVNLGRGNIICAGSILTIDIEIGDFNIINLNCTISHDVRIGNFTIINSGVGIAGNVVIESLTEIGAGSKVIQGKRIGQQTVIGAGAVVISDIPDDCTAVGVPAKVIKYH